jgi:L-iditol 2-dehydrogenase
MKALVLHGPGRYSVETEWPDPVPRPGWAVVQVGFAGVCGSDLPRFAVTGSYHHPMILGHEFAGTVLAPAGGSSRFSEGDRVAVLPLIPCGQCAGCLSGEPFHCSRYQFLGSRNDGGFAELCLVPEDNLFALPLGLDLRLGAMIEPLAVALHVVRQSGFRAGQSALVYGAGTIGLLVAFWLRELGAARVAVADVRAESLAIARGLGFNEAFDAGSESPGGNYDAVFEAAGSGRALTAAIDQARDKGTLTVVGRDTADTVLPHAAFERFMRKELRLFGCWGYNLKGDEALLYQTLARGSLPLARMITREVDLAGAPAVIAQMIDRRFHYCKVLVEMKS